MNAPKEQESKYMIIEALEDNFSITISGIGSPRIEYSVDGNMWNTLDFDQTTPVINNGERLLFKGNYTFDSWNSVIFNITKQCNLKGSCMALLGSSSTITDNTLIGRDRAFHSLFSDCIGIISVDKTFLPATTLSTECYLSMFKGCTNLTTAPELPATTLANLCYYYMFEGCTSLTTVPELPATTLTMSCYRGMFSGCSSLTVAPELPATILTDDCYSLMFTRCSKLNYIKMLAIDISASSCLNNWVYNVSKTGTFVKNPNMTSLPSGNSGIPSGWTVVDDGEE